MLLRFHVAEEVTRGPFGVQTRQNLDSSQRFWRHGRENGPTFVELAKLAILWVNAEVVRRLFRAWQKGAILRSTDEMRANGTPASGAFAEYMLSLRKLISLFAR